MEELESSQFVICASCITGLSELAPYLVYILGKRKLET